MISIAIMHAKLIGAGAARRERTRALIDRIAHAQRHSACATRNADHHACGVHTRAII
jgi:hypothetical protein